MRIDENFFTVVVDPVSTLLSLALLVALLLFWFNKKAQPLEVRVLNDEWDSWKRQLHQLILSRRDFKQVIKALKQTQKKRHRSGVDQVCYVLEFDGDWRASQMEALRREISAILTSAKPQKDEVVVLLNSPGGSVADYGLGWAQLMRLRQAGLFLTVVVDKVAASGGYLMALAANKIVANEFALIGSIGVVAEIFNFHGLLQRMNVDFIEVTAGEAKRTVTPFSPVTYEKKVRLKQQLTSIHEQFLAHLRSLRPQADWQQAASAEVWTGQRALGLGLVDELATSDQVIQERIQKGVLVLQVRWRLPRGFSQRLAEGVLAALESRLWRWLSWRW